MPSDIYLTFSKIGNKMAEMERPHVIIECRYRSPARKVDMTFNIASR